MLKWVNSGKGVKDSYILPFDFFVAFFEKNF